MNLLFYCEIPVNVNFVNKIVLIDIQRIWVFNVKIQNCDNIFTEYKIIFKLMCFRSENNDPGFIVYKNYSKDVTKAKIINVAKNHIYNKFLICLF